MQPARVTMFNPISNKPLIYIRYKRILQAQSNLELAQSITGLEMTRYQLTSEISQIFLINEKQPKKYSLKIKATKAYNQLKETEYIVV